MRPDTRFGINRSITSTTYFICGCAIELPTRNFKLYQHIIYSDKSCHDNMIYFKLKFAALAQMVACLPLVQHVRGSIPGRVVNFHLKIFNLRARRGEDVYFLIAKL